MAHNTQRDPAGKVSKQVLQACLTNANVSFKSSSSRARLIELVEKYDLNPLAVHPLPLLSLPSELVQLIASLLAKGSEGSKALIRLGSVCKELHSIINGSDEVWRAAWEVHAGTAPPKSLEGMSERTSCKQRMLLLANMGCQLCNKHPRAKTITWAFGVRTCAGCLSANLMSQNWAIKHYELPKDEMEHITRLDYGCHGETWSYHYFYLWKPDVLPLLTKVHGVASWEEYETMRRERRQAAWTGRQQARAAQVEERAKQRAQQVEQYVRQKKQDDKAKRKKRKREQSARKAAKRQRLQATEMRALEIDMHL